jgi:hypothetical protein
MENVYFYIAQQLFNKQQYGKSMKYCNTVLHWAHNTLIPKHSLFSIYRILSRIAHQRKQFTKQMSFCWQSIDCNKSLANNISYGAFTDIFRRLQSAIGYEALTLFSYARKSTDPPPLSIKGITIAEELY